MVVCSGLSSDVDVYIFLDFDPMSGWYPKNVSTLDLFVIIACLCICMFPDFGSMPGQFPRNVCMFPDFGPMSGGA